VPQTHKTLTDFNTLHPKIQFTIETETDNSLNYLDLTITNKENRLTFGIFRKPTTTDLIIHNDSCHPYEHKKSAINYLVNHMSKYPITKENKTKEKQTICNILRNNHYNKQVIYQKQKTSQNAKGKEKNIMGNFYISWQQHKDYYKTIQEY
jgi:hypothetical protein